MFWADPFGDWPFLFLGLFRLFYVKTKIQDSMELQGVKVSDT